MINSLYASTASVSRSGSGILSFLPLVLIFLIFYFLVIRPQQKKAKEHSEMLKSIKVGDIIVNSGGIYGTLLSVSDTYVDIDCSVSTKMKILRSSIVQIVGHNQGRVELDSDK